jgi:hypothetical protein
MCEPESALPAQTQILWDIFDPMTPKPRVWTLTKQLVKYMWHGKYTIAGDYIILTIPCSIKWRFLNFAVILREYEVSHVQEFHISEISNLIVLLRTLTSVSPSECHLWMFRKYIQPTKSLDKCKSF